MPGTGMDLHLGKDLVFHACHMSPGYLVETCNALTSIFIFLVKK